MSGQTYQAYLGDPEYMEIPRMVAYKAHHLTGLKPHLKYINALQPLAECEALHHAHEESGVIHGLNGGTVRYDSSYVPAGGGKGEDRRSVSAVSSASLRKALKVIYDKAAEETWWSRWGDLQAEGEEKDLLFFTVIDGHMGAQVCDLLEVAANACMAWAIGNDPTTGAGDEEAIKQALSDA